MPVSPRFNDILGIHYTILHLLEQVFIWSDSGIGQRDQSFIPSRDSSSGSSETSCPCRASSKICSLVCLKPASLSSSICLIYAHGLRLPLGLRCLQSACPPCTPYIRFLFVRLQFRYPFFSPTPHDVNLGSRYEVRRQLRPLWTFTTD